jgi:hypothetical protein
MYQGEPVDAAHTLDETGLLDGFFQFLRLLRNLLARIREEETVAYTMGLAGHRIKR